MNGNWDEIFYHFLCKNFCFKTNGLPFELLAKAVPQNLYAKHKNRATQIEALILGGAGLLNDKFNEDYPLKLKAEFEFLQRKYNIIPIEASLWKFMRMRPQNFPTLRLAQLVALVIKQNHLFSKIIEIKEVVL